MKFRTYDLVVLMICGTFVLLSTLFATAAVFAPDFRAVGLTISLGILGAVGTLLTTALGARALSNGKKEEDNDKPA